MKAHDPNQLNIFYDVPQVRENLAGILPPEPMRVQDKLAAALANDQTLIRLQTGYDNEWGKAPWIIKQQTKEGAGGWHYLTKFDTEAEAREEYNRMLESGLYVEG